jgi:hypothetical protein
MRYDRLTILLARVIADQDDYGYCSIEAFLNINYSNLVILP